MILVENNPFKILGVFANATEKDIHRQKVKAKKFSSVNKPAPSELDFSVLKSVERTPASIDSASSSIEQRQKKLEHAMFWFVNQNSIDDIAFEHLRNGNISLAMSTWRKVVDNRSLTERNISCLNNIMTVQLLSRDELKVKHAIERKIEMIMSEAFVGFVESVTDETFVAEPKNEVEKFINALISNFDAQGKSKTWINQLFANCDLWVKDFVSFTLCKNNLHEIEVAVSKAKVLHSDDKSKGIDAGETLLETAEKLLPILSSVLGSANLKYTTSANSVADELNLCAIAYYNECYWEAEPVKRCLHLLNKATFFATKTNSISLFEKNIAHLSEELESKALEDKYQGVFGILDSYKNERDSISNAKQLVYSCLLQLKIIKSDNGSTHYHTEVSSIVATVALSTIISVVNSAQETNRSASELFDTFDSALSVLNNISELNMDKKTKSRFDQNYKTITNLKSFAKDKKNEKYSTLMVWGGILLFLFWLGS